MQLEESAAEVTAAASRYAWWLMSDDQRDQLIREIIAPRWRATTSDHVLLNSTFWGSALGTSAKTIEGRVERFLKKERTVATPPDEPKPNQKASVRSAKAAMKKHPSLTKELVEDPVIRAQVVQALKERPAPDTTSRAQRAHVEDVEKTPKPSPRQAAREAVALTEPPGTPVPADVSEALSRLRCAVHDVQRAGVLVENYNSLELGSQDYIAFRAALKRLGLYQQALTDWHNNVLPLDVELRIMLEAEGGDDSA